MKKISKHTEKK